MNTCHLHYQLQQCKEYSKEWWDIYLKIKSIENPNFDLETTKIRSGYYEYFHS
jgi:hypothetical protein